MQVDQGKLSAMRQALSRTAASQGTSAHDYLQALEKAPELVESESNPLLFLLRENGNINEACTRLFLYWTYRKQIFGDERAFKSLVSGEALGEIETKIVESGAVVRLPCDDQGREVYFLDSKRQPKGEGTKEWMNAHARFFFYMFQQGFSNPKSQTEGAVLLISVHAGASASFPNWAICRDLIHRALPFKFHSVHICGCPQPGTKNLFRDILVPKYLELHSTWCEDKNNASFHIESTPDRMLQVLKGFGFHQNKVPAVLGGTWSHPAWTNKAKHVEETDSKPSAVAAPGKLPRKREIESNQFARGQSPFKNPNVQDIPVEKLIEEVVKAPGMPAPCRHVKRPCSEDTLKKYGAAKLAVVARTEETETDEEDPPKNSFRKRMNVVYCRRKYYKRKLKFESLINTHGSLLLENKKLTAESKRLERLVKKATDLVAKLEGMQLSGHAVAGRLPTLNQPQPISQDLTTRLLLRAQYQPIGTPSALSSLVSSPPLLNDNLLSRLQQQQLLLQLQLQQQQQQALAGASWPAVNTLGNQGGLSNLRLLNPLLPSGTTGHLFGVPAAAQPASLPDPAGIGLSQLVLNLLSSDSSSLPSPLQAQLLAALRQQELVQALGRQQEQEQERDRQLYLAESMQQGQQQQLQSENDLLRRLLAERYRSGSGQL